MKLLSSLLILLLISLPLSAKSPFQLEGSAFNNDDPIPEQYSKDGGDLSPPLTWKNLPKGTQSLVLICEDPDAPNGTWIHWVLYNIPTTLTSISEGGANLPQDVTYGRNSWGNLSYNGPKPPSGTHHYEFRLYAIDAPLNLDPGLESNDLKKAMDGHILGVARLVGLYSHRMINGFCEKVLMSGESSEQTQLILGL